MKTLNKGNIDIQPIELTNEEVLYFLNMYKTTSSYIARGYALKKLIASHIKLVYSIASKFLYTGIDYKDLVSEGKRGLITAIDKYDSSKEVKLITYAYMWIVQSIQRSLGLYKEVYIPDEVRILYGKIIEVVEQYKQENGGLEPSREYIAKTLKVSLKKINNAINGCKTIYSYDKQISSDSEACFADMVADNTNIHNQLVLEDTNNELDNILKSSLSDNEYYVLTHYFGLNNNDKLQLKDIASRLNLSIARIKQLKYIAINKLRDNKALSQLYY